jgi:hypothetical protein
LVPSGREKAFALSSALGGSVSVVDSVLGNSGKLFPNSKNGKMRN